MSLRGRRGVAAPHDGRSLASTGTRGARQAARGTRSTTAREGGGHGIQIPIPACGHAPSSSTPLANHRSPTLHLPSTRAGAAQSMPPGHRQPTLLLSSLSLASSLAAASGTTVTPLRAASAVPDSRCCCLPLPPSVVTRHHCQYPRCFIPLPLWSPLSPAPAPPPTLPFEV